jgi:hypothetical protein
MLATVVCASATTKEVDAVAKQIETPRPGQPMLRKSASVPRAPSRKSMKQIRNAAAKTERQNTMVQLSPVSMKRAIAPPKLQVIADPVTSRTPSW